MFLLPLAWKLYGARVRATIRQGREELMNRVALMGLTRAHAVGIQLMLLFSLWLNSSLSNRLISLSVGVIAIRCQLDPNEASTNPSHCDGGFTGAILLFLCTWIDLAFPCQRMQLRLSPFAQQLSHTQ